MKSNGFTLIELIVALVVVGLIFPLILHPLMLMLVQGSDLDYLEKAARLAEQESEYVSGLRFSDAVSIPTANFTEPDDAAFQRAVNIDYVQGPSDLDTNSVITTNYKRARITVLTPKQRSYTMGVLLVNTQ